MVEQRLAQKLVEAFEDFAPQFEQDGENLLASGEPTFRGELLGVDLEKLSQAVEGLGYTSLTKLDERGREYFFIARKEFQAN